MRMDEYQKWLEAQFFDDEAEEQTRQPEAVVHEVIAETPAEAVAVPAGFVTQSAETHAVPPASQKQAPERDESLESSPAALPSSVVEEPSPASAPSSFPILRTQEWDEEADVPAIENYLTFLRTSQQAHAAAKTEDQPPAQSVTELPDVPDESISQGQSETLPEAASVVNSIEVTTLPGLEAMSGQPESPTSHEPPAIIEEKKAVSIVAGPSTPEFRGRKARNVKVTRNVEPLQFDSLWELVPKHIQVLVAMGSDDQVVQNSYRRSFKESRIELIEKLLDPTLSLEDTARLLNVCPTTVRRYTNKGLLTHQRTTGDQRRFKLSDVLSFLEAQSNSGKPTGQSRLSETWNT